MARRKHPKLPNGFGSIKKLSGNRTNPYAVYPPTTEFTPNGAPKTQKALCYVRDWYTGFYALMEYKNGTFNPEAFQSVTFKGNDKDTEIINKIIASYNRKSFGSRNKKTFSEVYNMFYAYKYERPNARNFSSQSQYSTKAAYKNCVVLHNLIFDEITADQLQKVIDDCPLAHSSKELIQSLYRQMYRYAYSNNLCSRDISKNIAINVPEDDEKGVPFSAEDIQVLWNHKNDNGVVKSILIMIYTGFRISEYSSLEIDMMEKVFRGGMKTDAGKNRIVPFHEAIVPLLDNTLDIFTCAPQVFRSRFYDELNRLGIPEKHTPHDTRHTFSWLCDKAKIDMLSKKLLMGHSLGNDVTDARYGHRTTEELRTEINKIICC